MQESILILNVVQKIFYISFFLIKICDVLLFNTNEINISVSINEPFVYNDINAKYRLNILLSTFMLPPSSPDLNILHVCEVYLLYSGAI